MIEKLILSLQKYGPVSDEERRVLEQGASQVRDYAPHEDIVREGECPAESCLVLEGYAGRYKLLAQGTRQIMALHIPGDFCDLHSFVLKRMDHGIAAISPCKIARFPHALIKEITEHHPRLGRALWWVVATDGAVMREWMISMGRRSAREQIAHLLCELFFRLQTVKLVQDDSYELPVTQAELGDAFGLSTVHVNRVLQDELRPAGLITLTRNRLTVNDWEGLAALGEFDPTYLHQAPREAA